MVAISGQQAGVNRARLRSMQMAVEELNTLGGVPTNGLGTKARPLVLVSCDESVDAERAARHLTNDLHVAGIIGPTDSQKALDVTTRVSIPADTLTISPTAIADGLTALRDKDLSWLVSPSDGQRAALLIAELQQIERTLRAQRARDLKLGIVFEEGAVGAGTRSALVDLTWNGEPLSMASNQGTNVKLSGYDPQQPSQTELVASYAAFAPDVMVLVGGNSIVRDVMAPLEAAGQQPSANAPRPEYVFIDAAKGPELLQLVANDPSLQRRVRGTGVAPSPDSETVFRSFLVDYEAHYPDDALGSSPGVGPSYDAVYAVAYAMVAGHGAGSANIARGLPLLYTPGTAPLQVGPFMVVSAFQQLLAAQPIALQGTFSALTWDERGAIASGTLEIWCVDLSSGAAYVPSGLTADVATRALSGENRLCPVQGSAGMANSAAMPPMAAAAQSGSSSPAGGLPPAVPADAGVPQDAGSSDMPDAGAADGGGPQVGGATRRSSTARPTPCGGSSCDSSIGEYCCIEAVLGESGAQASRFRCAVGAASCAAVVQCSSDNECGSGEVCCVDSERNARCTAAQSCGSQELHLGCNRKEDCDNGELCCGQGDARELRATGCAARCEPAPGSVVCGSQAQCPSAMTCRQNWALPSVGMCVTTEPMPGMPAMSAMP